MNATTTDAKPAEGKPTVLEERNGQKHIPKSLRDRVLGVRAPVVPPTTDEAAAKAKADADKAKADADKAKSDAEKAKADAAANGAAPAARVKKVKAGPELPPETTDVGRTSAETLKEVVREVVAETNRPVAESVVAQPTLDPEVQREIDIARFAESKHGEKYAGMAKKVGDFFSSRDQLIAAKKKEFGGERSPEFREWLDGDEFKGWVDENRPSYQRGDKSKLTEEMIVDRAREEARREFRPELDRIERERREIEVKPVIDRVTTHLIQSVILVDPAEKPEDKDPALTGFAADPKKFGEEHPEEARLIAQDANEVVELVGALYRIDRGAVDFDPKKPTEQQRTLRDFSVQQNAALRKEHPNGIEMQDGKILIDAETFTKRALHKDSRYRVFNTEELAGMLAHDRRERLLVKLKARRDGVTKSVYAPKKEGASAAPAAQNGQGETKPIEEERSPSASVSRASNTRATPPEDARKKRNKYL